MPNLSIIIPTHKRPNILKKCLEHIGVQTVRDDLEVIVVSDGPCNESKKVCTESKLGIPLKYLEIEKTQQGVARNKGVEIAEAQLVLFIGDDIFLMPDACQKHLETHAQQIDAGSPLEIAVLGYTTWDPDLEINPTMKWLEKSGWQFGYPKLKNYEKNLIPYSIQERFTYTSHISLPRDIALKHPFSENVSLYGWEDIEWGKRLKEHPLKLFYQPEAKAMHHHSLTHEDSLARMETLGRSIHHFPDIGRKPKGVKRLGYEITAFLPTMKGKHRKAFLKGLKKHGKPTS
ncbi:MAG: glycosyltransferase [Candidatus Peribacteraceae bacterium]|nr:glycosyltransferase [Candidatus Peribacteraceae bacterium]MDP7454797.1 glycosyltransferase [Candidatus Peribacteraceae bacterium]MDP7646274.1 glycosyltransferase [Candidatus Peribacteraceae bacterium]